MGDRIKIDYKEDIGIDYFSGIILQFDLAKKYFLWLLSCDLEI